MGTFSKDAAIIAQNAGTTSAALLERLNVSYDSVEDLLADFDQVRDAVFQGSISLAGAETVLDVFEYSENDKSKSRGGYNRGGSSSGGGNRQATSDGGGGSNGGAPGDTELNFGKHRGKTISDVYDEDSEYVEWLAEKANSTFVKRQAREFLKNAA